MSLLDLLLIAIVGGSVVFGFLAGFARAGVGFLADSHRESCSVSGSTASRLRGSTNSSAPSHFSNLAGFLVVFFVCTLLGALIGKLLSKLFKWTGLSWLDRLMGAGFGLVRGGLMRRWPSCPC